MDSLTSTYLSPPSNPEEWIERLDLVSSQISLVSSQITDPKNLLDFQQIKKVVKGFAKSGELSEKQREKVFSILSQKGFRIYTDDPRFRGLSVCPTALLLFSPKLYGILFYPERYPTEFALLNTLSDQAFEILILDLCNEKKLNTTAIEQLAEIIYVITLLPIPELEPMCKNFLNRQIILMNVKPVQIKTLYLLAAVWPTDQAPLFSRLLQTSSWTSLDCLPVPDSSKAVVEEFKFFNQVMTGTQEKGWEELSPLALYRLFLLIHEESKIFPTLCSLRLKIFDRLLTYLKSGELNAKYGQKLIAEAQGSFDLCKCLKEDRLTIASWAAVNKNYALMTTCLFHYCQNRLEFTPDDAKYTLTSLQAKPLKILKAVGTDVKCLKIKVNTDSEALKEPWVKIAEACPHVEKLYLEITGAVTPLDSFPLTQFSKLWYLGLLVHDSKAWKSLGSLRIPATIERICLQGILMNQIEEISNYEFFSHLPSKGITLMLTNDSSKPTFSSWRSYFSSPTNPVKELFRHLSHCTELKIYGRENFLPPLEYLITYNQRLESLSLDYFDICPTVNDLHMLKNGLPKLKKFHIDFNTRLKSSRIADLIKFLMKWREESKSSTEITWYT